MIYSWLAGHRDPQDLRQCGPVAVKGQSPGPATSYQQSGDWGLQDSSPADSRTGGLEDWYLSRLEDWKDLTLDSELKPLAAWWPLSRGAGGYAWVWAQNVFVHTRSTIWTTKNSCLATVKRRNQLLNKFEVNNVFRGLGKHGSNQARTSFAGKLLKT